MTQDKPRRQPRRTQADLRERLLAAALTEFATFGFDGASTRRIAKQIGAHQPQINYHFASKELLWQAAVGHLFTLLTQALDSNRITATGGQPLALEFAALLRRLVSFVACHPELNRIMVHESTCPGPRLEWMTGQFVKPFYQSLQPLWKQLVRDGIAAPIHPKLIHHALVGAASLVFVNAHELALLNGVNASSPYWVKAHAEGLIATFLPGLHCPESG